MGNKPSREVIGDYFTLQRGTTYKSNLLGEPGPYLLGLASIQKDGGFRSDNLKTYGGECPDKISLLPGDLYVSLKDVTQSAALLGAVARVPNWCVRGRLTQDTVKLVPINDDVPSDYLYWVLRTPAYRSYCRSRATGTTNLGLAREDFLSFPAPEPGPQESFLVETLEVLENKIELNRQMNRTLEQMAQIIFKSWFIDFDPVVYNAVRAGNPVPARFEQTAADYRENPDALKVPRGILELFPDSFQSSELGDIPNGWTLGRLGDVIDIHDGKRVPLNSRERAKRCGPYRYYGAAGVMDYVDDYIFDGIYVLVGEDGSVIDNNNRPITQYVWGKFWVNNHAHILSGKNSISNEFLYVLLINVNIRPFVTGAVQPKVSQKNLKAVPIVLPCPKLRDKYASIIDPLFRQLRNNFDQTASLEEVRDTLLPKLVSGDPRIPCSEDMSSNTSLAAVS